MIKRIGQRTLELTQRPRIVGFGSAAGKKEGEGPLAQWFDEVFADTTMGGETWEKAESLFQKEAVDIALKKANVSAENIDYIFAGDLLN